MVDILTAGIVTVEYISFNPILEVPVIEIEGFVAAPGFNSLLNNITKNSCKLVPAGIVLPFWIPAPKSPFKPATVISSVVTSLSASVVPRILLPLYKDPSLEFNDSESFSSLIPLLIATKSPFCTDSVNSVPNLNFNTSINS